MMKKRNLASSVLITAFVLTAILPALLAAEPKPLTKDQAAKLLASMGYEDIAVGAIVQGVAAMTSTPNGAMVLAIARRNGEIQKVELQVFYDADTGWFYHEYDTPPTRLRIWSLSGYDELRPKLALTDKEVAEKILGTWKPKTGDAILVYTKDGRWTQKASGKTLAGTWKCENGVIISTEGGAISRFPILTLERSTLVLKVKRDDGTVVSAEFSRAGDN
jgi:hypothetical protein